MKTQLCSLLLAVLFVACGAMKSRADYDKKTDFSVLKSYSWMVGSPLADNQAKAPRPRVVERVRQAVEKKLAGKGYQKTADKADFVIAQHVSSKDMVDVRKVYAADEWAGYGAVETYQYLQGSLVLSIFSGAEKKLIWRGFAEAEIDPEITEEALDRKVDRAVSSVLERFPPRLRPSD